MRDKRVSIIITCYNLERFLGDAVNSVRQQTILPLETIIVHDGCQKPTVWDNTTTLLRQKNLGVAKSRDEGVRLSSGELLVFLDADDCLTENYIEECLKVFNRGNVDIAYPNTLLWSYWGEEKPLQNRLHQSGSRVTLRDMIKYDKFLVVSSMMKRTVYEKIGGFDKTLSIYEDWDFWLKAITMEFSFRRANTYLKYRQRENSRNRQNEDLRSSTIKQIRERYQSFLNK